MSHIHQSTADAIGAEIDVSNAITVLLPGGQWLSADPDRDQDRPKKIHPLCSLCLCGESYT
jgi:hypothetical protein